MRLERLREHEVAASSVARCDGDRLIFFQLMRDARNPAVATTWARALALSVGEGASDAEAVGVHLALLVDACVSPDSGKITEFGGTPFSDSQKRDAYERGVYAFVTDLLHAGAEQDLTPAAFSRLVELARAGLRWKHPQGLAAAKEPLVALIFLLEVPQRSFLKLAPTDRSFAYAEHVAVAVEAQQAHCDESVPCSALFALTKNASWAVFLAACSVEYKSGACERVLRLCQRHSKLLGEVVRRQVGQNHPGDAQNHPAGVRVSFF